MCFLARERSLDHRIHTEDDIPVNQQYRRIPPNQFEEVKKQVQVLLERGVIRPGQSDLTMHRLLH